MLSKCQQNFVILQRDKDRKPTPDPSLKGREKREGNGRGKRGDK